MKASLLHVVSARVRTAADVDDALRHLRRLHADSHTLLLFADFHAAPAQRLPGDAPLLRRMQSGVMAMNAQRPGQFLMLWRRRVWDDAARLYLGFEQAQTCRDVIAGLLGGGRTQAVFDAATFAPPSLQGRYDAVLFSDVSLLCTPDTPARMLDALGDASCVCAPVVSPRAYPETVFARLVRTCGFSLSPLAAARGALAPRGMLDAERHPLLLRAPSLAAPAGGLAPAAAGCFFMRRRTPTLPPLFAAHQLACRRDAGVQAFLAPLQVALFFLSALLGLPLLAALALLPEAACLLRPRLLPGALLRTALLPLIAAVSLDALLCRRFAQARRFRPRLPDALMTAPGCLLVGSVLLPVSIASAQALPALLPVALLWLGAPLLLPALHAPSMERIPLDESQQAQLRTLAESAYFDAARSAEQPSALRMLAACAGCMLGVLEPDEAARQVQALLPDAHARTAGEQAAALACAQFLRERMADCDAALRDLPQAIEAFVRAQPLPAENGRLAAFLRIARSGDASSDALAPLSQAGAGNPLDALFLPLGPARATPCHTLTLPLTHPHTFLSRLLTAPDAQTDAADALPRFLALSAAALAHPFYALLMRSPVTAPYAPLLCL